MWPCRAFLNAVEHLSVPVISNIMVELHVLGVDVVESRSGIGGGAAGVFELWASNRFQDGSWQAWYVWSIFVAEIVNVLSHIGELAFEDVVPGIDGDFIDFDK